MRAFRFPTSAPAFRLDYLCDTCPHEWEARSARVSADYCPSCDQEVEPYLWVDLREEVE